MTITGTCRWLNGSLSAINALTDGAEAALCITRNGRTTTFHVAAVVENGRISGFRVRRGPQVIDVDASFDTHWSHWESVNGHSLHKPLWHGMRAIGLIY